MSARRGEVLWIAFDPAIGTEIQKTRPAIVLSKDLSNMAARRLSVVPLTSNVSRICPAEAVVVVNGKQSKAMADQIPTASAERVRGKGGILNGSDIRAVEAAVKRHLGFIDARGSSMEVTR